MFRRSALAADRRGAARQRSPLAAVTARASKIARRRRGPCRARARCCDRCGARPVLEASEAPAPGAAGLERTLRPRSARQDLGRPVDPRGVRERTRRRPCRAPGRARTVAREISRPGASGGTRRSPGAASVVGCRPVPLARRRRGHGDLSAGCPGGTGPGPAPRRAGQRDLRASDRRGHAGCVDGRSAAHRRALPAEHARRRARERRQDRAAGGPGARPVGRAGRDLGAPSRVSLAAGLEGRIGRALRMQPLQRCWRPPRGCGQTC